MKYVVFAVIAAVIFFGIALRLRRQNDRRATGSPPSHPFQLRVDDAFALKTPGRAVVVGVVAEGSASTGDDLVLHTSEGPLPTRVEGMETYPAGADRPVEVATARVGDRVGIMISGVSREQISPGDRLAGPAQDHAGTRPAPHGPAGAGITRTTSTVSESRYRAGQVWTYKTRLGEESSRLTILKVEPYGKPGDRAVHVRLDGVRIGNPQAEGGASTWVGHLPFAEEALDRSVVALSDAEPEHPLDFDGYDTWKRAADEGKAGVFTTTVAEVVGFLEEGMTRQAR